MAETTPTAEPTRRDFLFIATGATAAIGVGAVAWPFIAQLAPDAEVVAAGAPIEVDLSPIGEGQIVRVFWRDTLIFVRHRTPEEIEAAQETPLSDLPDPEPDSERVVAGQEQWLIVFGNCTHFGCVPLDFQGQYRGWFCPCHGSVFDTSGRIRSGPAPTNLPLPPYEFVDDMTIIIGEA